MPSADAGERQSEVLRVAAGCEPTKLALSAREGFLFSRIDGATPWNLLREIGGLSSAEVDACLERWVEDGVVEVASPAVGAHSPTRAAARAGAVGEPGGIDESLIDASLEISVEAQRRVLEYEAEIDRDYHELLGVGRDAPTKEVKRAYFKLSKEFHPDRYFRKRVGAYGERLSCIFKRVLEAYELLSDPTLRAEMQKSLAAAASAAPSPPAPDGEPPRELTPVERLRARMRFKLPPEFMAQRSQKAREFFEASRIQQEQGAYIEAAQTRRLAIAFDPFIDEFRAGLGELQALAVEMKAERMMREAASAESPITSLGGGSPAKEALRLYEEVLLYRPHDAELNDKVALCSLEVGQLDKARECAETAIERCPEVPAYRLTMAKVYLAQQNRGHAARELEQVLQLDPGDQEARTLLARLRRARSAPEEGA